MQNPWDSHHEATLHVLCYLKSSPEHGLFHYAQCDLRVSASDFDWASCPTTHRSMTGFFILLGASPISWRKKIQAVVSHSSVEAEYRAMVITTCKLVWLKSLQRDLAVFRPQQILLYCDNEVDLHITRNPIFYECTKHIKIDCHFVRERFLSLFLLMSPPNSNWLTFSPKLLGSIYFTISLASWALCRTFMLQLEGK